MTGRLLCNDLKTSLKSMVGLVEKGRQEPSVGVEVYGIGPRAVGVTFHIDEGTP